MENFRIDFTLSNPFPDGKKIGESGEKNAAQLIITPPENLASREEIKSYVVAFSTERGPVRIGPFHKAETLTVPVKNALTVGTALSVQLEGYDADGEFIIKSPVLSGIVISSSIGDCDCSDGSANENVIPGHLHDNLDVLDCFSEKNGVLTYKGCEVSSELNVKTVVLNLSDGAFYAFTDIPTNSCFTIVSPQDENGMTYIPDGARIVSVELNIASYKDPEWVDLRDMNNADFYIPYIVNSYRAFYSEYLNGTVIAIVYFPKDKNYFYDAISNYSLYGVRVKYIAESGEAK